MAIVTEKKNRNWLKEAKTAIKDVVLPRKDVPLWNYLPYKRRITNKKGHENILELNDDLGFAALVNIPGKDLDFMSSDGDTGSSAIIRDYHQFLSVYTPDWSAIITQLPADTTNIQISWNSEGALIEQAIPNVTDERKYKQLLARRELVKHQLMIAKNVSSEMKHQEYTGIIYGNTLSEVIENEKLFMQEGRSAIQPTRLSGERVEQILRLLNDPTSDID